MQIWAKTQILPLAVTVGFLRSFLLITIACLTNLTSLKVECRLVVHGVTVNSRATVETVVTATVLKLNYVFKWHLRHKMPPYTCSPGLKYTDQAQSYMKYVRSGKENASHCKLFTNRRQLAWLRADWGCSSYNIWPFSLMDLLKEIKNNAIFELLILALKCTLRISF